MSVSAWMIKVPGTPAMVPLLRQWTRAHLENSPLFRAVEVVVTELVTNAIRHSASGEAGGGIHVQISDEDDAVRIDVRDDGPRSRPPDDWTAEDAADFGRGLAIINELSVSWGEEKTGAGRLTWAVVKDPL